MTIRELMDAYPERIRRAFLAGIRQLRDQIIVNDVIRALERRDVEGAIEALYLERAAFREFEAELEAAFGDGGVSQVEELGRLEDQQGARFIFRFNARNLRAEQLIRDHSSRLVTGIVDEQSRFIRSALQEGLARGDNPRTTALYVVGRAEGRSQMRQGGIIGLSAPQERAVTSARQELEAGDFSAYLRRTRRDRRFDGTIRNAAREGRSLTRQEVQRLTGRYSDRLLALRGEAIARTETLSALNLGRYEAIQQLVDTGKVNRSDVKLVWNAAKDLRTRDTHRALDGESVTLGEAFVSPRGARLRYPGDPQAPASELVNCRCNLRVDIRFRAN